MTSFKPFREITIVDAGEDMDGKPAIQYANGDEFVMTDVASIQRLVDCWNACRKIAFPVAHIGATDETVQRLEGLRRAAWARAVELGAQDYHRDEGTPA